jgi:hypothetical protein
MDETVCGKEEVGCVLTTTPFYFVDFLFYLERFEVVKLGLVRLELVVEFVLTTLLLRTLSLPRQRTYAFESLKEHDSPALVAGCEIVACVIKLDGGDDVGWSQHVKCAVYPL